MREVEADMPTMKIILAETLNNADLRKQVNDTIYTPMFTIAEMYIQHLMDTGQIESGDPKQFARMMAAPVFGLLMLRLLGDEHVVDNWETYGATVAEQLAGLAGKP